MAKQQVRILDSDGIELNAAGGQLPVAAGYKTQRITVSFTAIGAYSQYDACGALVEVPGWASAVSRGATLRRLFVEVDNNAIAPQFELHFFNASDATVAADNITWTSIAAEYAKRVGYILTPATAKPAGSGTIDLVRVQMPDNDGFSLDWQATCAAASTSLWLKLKLPVAATFASAPGNNIRMIFEIEQS